MRGPEIKEAMEKHADHPPTVAALKGEQAYRKANREAKRTGKPKPKRADFMPKSGAGSAQAATGGGGQAPTPGSGGTQSAQVRQHMRVNPKTGKVSVVHQHQSTRKKAAEQEPAAQQPTAAEEAPPEPTTPPVEAPPTPAAPEPAAEPPKPTAAEEAPPEPTAPEPGGKPSTPEADKPKRRRMLKDGHPPEEWVDPGTVPDDDEKVAGRSVFQLMRSDMYAAWAGSNDRSPEAQLEADKASGDEPFTGYDEFLRDQWGRFRAGVRKRADENIAGYDSRFRSWLLDHYERKYEGEEAADEEETPTTTEDGDEEFRKGKPTRSLFWDGMDPGYTKEGLDALGEAMGHRSEVFHPDHSGDKVAGSGRERWAQFNLHRRDLEAAERDGVAKKMVTLDRVWPEQTIDAAVAMGDTPGAFILKSEIRGYVKNKPVDKPESRRIYMEGCDWLQRSLGDLQTPDQIEQWADDLRRLVHDGADYDSTVQMDDLIAQGLARVETRQRVKRDENGHPIEKDGKYEYEDREVKRVDFSALQQEGYSTVSYGPKGSGEVRLYRRVPESVRDQYREYATALGGEIQRLIAGRLASGKRHKFFDQPMKTARKFDENKGIAIQAIKTGGEKVKEHKAKEEKKRWVWKRAGTAAVRKGGREVPKQATGQTIMDTFGMRDVEHGTWMTQGDRDRVVNHTHGALLDLADIIGFEDKELSHNGSLVLAFGSRGKGFVQRAAAHYTNAYRAINLTKTAGAGSLAHEWAHSLDAAMHAVSGDKPIGGRYASSGSTSKLPPKVRESVENVSGMLAYQARSDDQDPAIVRKAAAWHVKMDEQRRRLKSAKRSLGKAPPKDDLRAYNDAVQEFNREWRSPQNRELRRTPLKKTRFYAHAEALGSYWQTPHERFARAFEAFVEDELKSKGRECTFLVHGTETQYPHPNKKKFQGGFVDIYPQGRERQAINEAFREMFRQFNSHKGTHELIKGLFNLGTPLAIDRRESVQVHPRRRFVMSPARLRVARSPVGELVKGGLSFEEGVRRAGRVLDGVITVGDYRWSWKSLGPAYGVITTMSKGMAVPYHIVANGWEKAITMARQATQAFERGRVPEVGMYRQAVSLPDDGIPVSGEVVDIPPELVP